MLTFRQATAQTLSLVFNYSVPLMLAKWNIQSAFFFFGTCTLATVAMFFGLPEVRFFSLSPADRHDTDLAVPKSQLPRHRRHVPGTCACAEVQHIQDTGTAGRSREDGGRGLNISTILAARYFDGIVWTVRQRSD
jgi:hypothetical protein